MVLDVKERLMFGSLYPKEGSLLDQSLVKDITEKTQITKAEFEKIGFKSTPKGFTWNKNAKTKKVDFTSAELNFLKENVDRLDKAGKITQDLLGVCLKIKNYSPSIK